jgi:hypothetical protein
MSYSKKYELSFYLINDSLTLIGITHFYVFVVEVVDLVIVLIHYACNLVDTALEDIEVFNCLALHRLLCD